MSKVPILENLQEKFKLYWGMNPNTKAVYPWDSTIVEWNKFMISVEKIGDDHVGNVHISTVFLGTNHSNEYGPPVLFETMSFSEVYEYDEYQERYYTYEEALAGHKRIVEQVTNGIPLIERKTLKIKF